jgi:hypothetical protein
MSAGRPPPLLQLGTRAAVLAHCWIPAPLHPSDWPPAHAALQGVAAPLTAGSAALLVPAAVECADRPTGSGPVHESRCSLNAVSARMLLADEDATTNSLRPPSLRLAVAMASWMWFFQVYTRCA